MNNLFDWEGKLPEEDIEKYHQRGELFSSSNIKEMGKTPWHYYKNVICGEGKPTTSQALGTIVHGALLEDRFSELVAIPTKWETMADQKKRGVETPRSVADQKQDFIDHHNGFACSQTDYEKVEGMYEAFHQDSLAQSLVSKENLVEQGFAYWDQEHEVKCRFRPDIINLKKGYIVDYKTAQSARESSFKWAVIRYGYHISAAHYMIGAERLFPGTIKEFYFIVQENSHPFACATYRLSATDIMFGATLRSQYIKKIQKYTKLEEWPGYTIDIKELQLPDAGYDMEDFDSEAQ
jgi:hypothetical protein